MNSSLQSTINNYAPSMQDSVSEYWVARVVRQMKGCSPSKIDSVIQANLPPRTINWSQCLDTLEIPGLKGRLPYSTKLPHCYELGYFKDNTLLHPEIKVSPIGKNTEPLTITLSKDNNIGSILVICVLLVSLLIANTRNFIRHQIDEFFLPPKKREGNNSLPPTLGLFAVGTTYLVLSTIGALCFYYYAQGSYDLFFCQVSQYRLFTYYVGCFLCFFTVKYLLTSFINWIFFDKTSRQIWRDSYNFLLVAEATLLLPTIMAMVFLNAATDTSIILAISVIGIFKLGILYKTYSIFLGKIYCILHLLSYLCALEIIPLLSLGVVLIEITDKLSIIF